MKINRVIVIADILRHKNGHDGNTDMFFGLLSGIISRITEIPAVCFDRDQLISLQYDIYKAYGFDISTNTQKSTLFGGVPPEMWEAMCFVEPTSELLEIVKMYFQDSLVICREPSFILKKAFKALGIPFVEMAIHSARYLDDLVLGITSNVDSIYQKIKAYEMNPEYFYFFADLIRAESYRKYSYNRHPLDKNSAVFFAQTPIDRSLLDFEKKKIVNLFDYKNEFEEICSNYDRVYFKSHPHYKDEKLFKYLKKMRNVKILDDKYNTYDIICSPNIKLCFAISSGTLNEARFFGKETKSLLGQPYIYSDEVQDKNFLDKNINYISVRKDFFASYFWADILSDIINVKKQEVIDVSSVNNKFRRIIGTSWGYMDGDSQSVNSDVKNLKLVVENKIPSVFFEQISKELTNLVMKKFLKRIWQFVYENPRKFLKKRKFFGLYKTKTLSS